MALASPKRTDSETANILLVDDREEDLELTRIALFRRPKLRCNLHIARDGREAYASLSRLCPPIDLVLLDINMPDVNGFELLELIRANPALRRIPVVMCSGSDYEPDRQRAFNLGAIDYLRKPPRFAELKTIIARVPALKLIQDGPATILTRA